jgi:hypothetical protein
MLIEGIMLCMPTHIISLLIESTMLCMHTHMHMQLRRGEGLIH